jgi:anti-anti-sigma factor
MPINKSCKEGVVILEVDSDLIGHQARVFQEFCKELTAKGVKRLILNLQQVNSIDSLGASEICRVIEKGVDIRLINVSHSVGLFFKCHAPHLLERCCANETEAIKSVREDGLAVERNWVEKRGFQRKSIQFPVFFKWLEVATDSEEVEGTALNLSGGGLLLSPLQTDYPLSPLWEQLSLRLLLPELSTPILVEGRLTRSTSRARKWQMGIKFTRIDESDRDRIVDYVYNRVNS